MSPSHGPYLQKLPTCVLSSGLMVHEYHLRWANSGVPGLGDWRLCTSRSRHGYIFIVSLLVKHSHISHRPWMVQSPVTTNTLWLVLLYLWLFVTQSLQTFGSGNDGHFHNQSTSVVYFKWNNIIIISYKRRIHRTGLFKCSAFRKYWNILQSFPFGNIAMWP